MDLVDVKNDIDEILISSTEIDERLTQIAKKIDADYKGKSVIIVGMLNGALMTIADLSRKLHIPVELDFISVSSYGNSTKSSGVVRIDKDLGADLNQKHVLFVEDIIDTGLTLKWILENFKARNAASVEIMSLTRKIGVGNEFLNAKYVGFDIPNKFVVGYGLDFAQKYRTLPFIATLSEHVYGN